MDLCKLTFSNVVTSERGLEEAVGLRNLRTGDEVVGGLDSTVKRELVLELSHYRVPIRTGTNPRVLS